MHDHRCVGVHAGDECQVWCITTETDRTKQLPVQSVNGHRNCCYHVLYICCELRHSKAIRLCSELSPFLLVPCSGTDTDIITMQYCMEFYEHINNRKFGKL